MTETIHFSQFVLNDIAENMAKAHWDWCDSLSYTNIGFNWDASEYQRDDWRLYVTGNSKSWFPRKAYLTRGERTTITLNKEQAKALILAWDKLEVRRLEMREEEKAKAKAKLERDQWWP